MIKFKSLKKYLFLLLIFISTNIYSQNTKEINAFRISSAPKIDGVINDTVWLSASKAVNFIQNEPKPGFSASQKSEVKILYDNSAVYISALLYDSAPDSINTQYTKRDDMGSADYFSIIFDPYKDAALGYRFVVSAAGVQQDMKVGENSSLNSRHQDKSWDAVWKSSVKILDNGWSAEIKIPYSALRFPKKDVQKWGVNMFRYVSRYRELSTWNEIDPKKSGVNQQNGVLNGITDIKSPIRLSITPFVAAYIEKQSEDNKFNAFVRGGMDLKYGITESFTLDLMLIPDFGQVQSDDQRLNLSPFEEYYRERRSFFTEGTELFKRANIFYSRRIGRQPRKYNKIDDYLETNERIIKNPSELQLVNATKITGKTKNGFSLGILNGISLKSEATIEDTVTSEKRDFTTQYFTNYNVFVIEQSLKNSSFISLINTNYATLGGNYNANVTGTELKFANKKNTYAIFAKGALSRIEDDTLDLNYGHFYDIRFAKISGNFLFSLSHEAKNDTYEPNEMGFLRKNNEIENRLSIGYNVHKPFWRLLKLNSDLTLEHEMQYSPLHYTSTTLSSMLRTTFKNYLTVGQNSAINLTESYDFYEARVAGRYFIKSAIGVVRIWVSSNYAKKFAINFGAKYWAAAKYNQSGIDFNIEPRVKPSDKWLITLKSETKLNKNQLGYAGKTENQDTIFFGARNQNTYINTLNVEYIFSNKTSISLKGRHFWSIVDYNKFYTLNNDGRIIDNAGDYSRDNINYNTFNIDLVYSWRFAPGSQLSIVWKNEIYSSVSEIKRNYFENLGNTLQSPQTNSISLKLLVYLDYLYLKRNK